ncbi:large ribosomal subunit protein uL22m-like [Corticium candelabrum]|uniref:large ribosomal subunit protein uL22m-like n=1 Tax=Corticium candelabrum TaxID=121492 RepID=UPI002E26C9F4|nr:large ribosomal subunit protein uL22m-like [Corticium candelabrum]
MMNFRAIRSFTCNTLRLAIRAPLHTTSCLPAKRPLFGKIRPRSITEEEYESRCLKDKPDKVTVYASRRGVKGSPWKMNLVAKQIRRLPVDEAMLQMQFSPKKASKTVLEVLSDAKKRAHEDFAGPNKSNLYIDESYVGKGTYLKRMKFHGKGQFGLKYRYHCHYFLKLREGPAPPKKTKRTYERHKSRITKDLWLRKTPVTIPNAL